MASTSNLNTADLLPDLSHLTEEEKQIIQNVMYRQQQEEAKEHEIVRRKADEVKILEDTIRQRNEQQRKAGVGLDATCQLCLKTKFADGIGHCCTYCGVRCCARCGGKVTLRSNKTIWVCILCRKKQELLIKTGQWINQPSCATPEKENRGPFSYGRAPLIRASSLQNQEPTRTLPTPQLRRQYSQEDRIPPNSNFPHYPYHGPGPGVHGHPRRASSSEPPELTHVGSGYYDSPYDHYGGRSYISGGVMDYHGQPPLQQPPHHPQQPQVLPHQQIQQIQQIGPSSGVQQYPIPLQGTGRTLPQPKIPLSTDTSTSWSPPYERKVLRHQLPKVPGVGVGGVKPMVSSPGGVNLQVQQQYRQHHHQQQQQGVQSVGGHSTIHVSVGGHQRSPSSSEEELRSTPDYTSGDDQNGRHVRNIQQVPVYQHRRDIKSPFETPSPAGSGGSQSSQIPGGGISGVNISGNNNNNTNNNNFHRYHGPPERRRADRSTRTKKTVRFDSDDFIGGSGPGDVGQNIQQVQQQQGPGGLPNISSSTGVGGGQVVGQQDWFLWDQASSAGSAERQGSQDSTTKDSGIDTCSNFTSSEDSNRELISSTKHHVSWRPNNDGSKLIGHMILKKDLGGMDGHGSSAHILGLKVVGGQVLENGRIGAVVEKIKKYSPADLIGRVQVGDEVIEWNGRSLMDKTYDEVYDIISESKQDGQVELIVSRGISGTGGNLPGPSKTYLNIRKDYRRPSVTITSPSSPDPRGIAGGAQSGGKFGPVVQQGKIQLKICFDPNMNQLMVTVLRACDLNCKHGVPSPFVKLCLLPDRSEKWKRRTRTLSSSREPRWNQNFVFSPLRHAEVRCRALQVSVWDCDLSRSQSGNPPVPEYLGETYIELSNHPLDDEPEWHFLTWDRNSSLYLETESNNPPHLSPPSLSTTSRHSDSDNSELDYERRLEIASISSSSSPPPDDLSGGVDPRRSRRDMSPLDKRQIHTDPDGYRRSVSASTQFRSKSPPRSYSPQTVHYQQQQQHIDEYNTMGPQGPPHLRSAHRSASGTPQGSPKKRQLPIIPGSGGRGQNMSQDIDERARQMRSKMRSSLSASSSYSSRGPSLENDGSLRSNRGISPDRSYIMDREWADPRLDSDLESVTSAFSTQSENPNRLSKPPSCQSACTSATDTYSANTESLQAQNLLQSSAQSQQRLPDNSHVVDQPHLFTSEYAMRHPKRSLGTRSLSSETAPDKADGSLSDTAVNMAPSSLDRPRGGHRMGTSPQRLTPQNLAGLSKKSNSTSQLSATGRKRRIGFGRSKGGIGVNRSEEVLPDLSQMGSSFSSEDMSQDNSDSSWMPKMGGPGSASSSTTGGLGSGQGSSEGGRITDFIEGLGPGQLVGRQVLASPALGDIQLSLCDRRGSLEVEVVRARGLQAKTGAKVSKITPAPYVKVYLVRGKKCVAKAKTGIARRTLDPLYQQQLVFREKYQSCILQVTVWGDYGRIEGRKVFMGVSQIMLDDLDLTNIVIGLTTS